MSQQPTTKSLPIAQLIGIAMLSWALVPSNPYGYYILLRIVICGICAFLAFKAYEAQRIGWVWTLGIAAIIYNPLIRVHMSREIWSVVNIATIILLAITIWTIREFSENRDESRDVVDRRHQRADYESRRGRSSGGDHQASLSRQDPGIGRALHAKMLGKNLSPPPLDDFTIRIVHTIRCFMDASMLRVNFSKSDATQHKRELVYGYAFGALDAVAKHNNADDILTLASATIFFMQYFEMSPEDAGRTTRICMDMINDPKRVAFIREGGQAIIDWTLKQDHYAPLRLFELLSEHTTS